MLVQPSQLTFKFIIVGNTGVGKSCLLLRYTKNEFTSTHYATIGMEFFSKRIVLNDVLIKLQIWDTAGQETFKSIIRNFYKNSQAAFIVYSIADRDSFDAVGQWYQQAKSNSPENTLYILIGSQKDLQQNREVTYEQGVKLMQKYGMILFFQTSSKLDQNVDVAFQQTAKRIIVNKLLYKDQVSDSTSNTIRLEDQNPQKTQNNNQSCC